MPCTSAAAAARALPFGLLRNAMLAALGRRFDVRGILVGASSTGTIRIGSRCLGGARFFCVIFRERELHFISRGHAVHA